MSEPERANLQALDRIRVVLVETSHPGNIGAAARAMKTMGLRHLYLVRPAQYPCAEATARASGADDLLARAVVCAELAEALAGCTLVMGASARLRTLRWPQLDPRDSGARAIAEAAGGGTVALLFGRERTGLSNEELDLCQYLIHVPANPEYSSLNLAAAVQIFAYELRMAAGAALPEQRAEASEAPAPVEAVEGFYEHLESTLTELGFLDPENPRHLMRRFRRLFGRVRLTESEVAILRGMLSAAQGRKLPRP